MADERDFQGLVDHATARDSITMMALMRTIGALEERAKATISALNGIEAKLGGLATAHEFAKLEDRLDSRLKELATVAQFRDLDARLGRLEKAIGNSGGKKATAAGDDSGPWYIRGEWPWKLLMLAAAIIFGIGGHDVIEAVLRLLKILP